MNLYFPLEQKSQLFRLTLGLLPTLLVVAGHEFFPVIANQLPALIHVPVVIFATWLAGFLPGTLSIIICGSFHYFHLSQHHLLYFNDIWTEMRVLLFMSMTFIFVYMVTILRMALSKANKAMALKDDFLNLASHELKTPITAIKLNLEVTQEILKDLTNAQQTQGLIDSSKRHILRLEKMVGAMMDVTQFESGQLILLKSECDLERLIQDSVYAFSQNNIIINKSEIPLSGYWDKVRIEQVLSNIIHNAIKYGGDKPITINSGKDQNGIWISIQDQGIGIHEKDHIRIFERFQRTNEALQVHGLGLGLYLAKKLVDLHQGSIKIVSSPHQGSTFTVILPEKNLNFADK